MIFWDDLYLDDSVISYFEINTQRWFYFSNTRRKRLVLKIEVSHLINLAQAYVRKFIVPIHHGLLSYIQRSPNIVKHVILCILRNDPVHSFDALMRKFSKLKVFSHNSSNPNTNRTFPLLSLSCNMSPTFTILFFQNPPDILMFFLKCF